MTTRPDAFFVTRVRNFATSCGRSSWALLGRSVVMLLVSLTIGSRATARDDSDEEEAVPVAGQRQFVLTEQQFDKMVFGGQQTVQRVVVVPRANAVPAVEVVQNLVAQTSVDDFRKRMDSNAAAEIETVDRRVSLTDGQKKKLKLAARGDVEQFVSRASELRHKLTSKPMNQQQYTELMRELQPLRMSQQLGIIRENSLFQKTLRGTLTDEQRVRFRTLERERHKVIIEAALLNLEVTDNRVALTGKTRQKFTDLILDHGQLPQAVGPYGQFIVLLEAHRLRDRVKPLLTEDEWNKLDLQIGQAKRFVPTLESYGLWIEHRSDLDDDGLTDVKKN